MINPPQFLSVEEMDNSQWLAETKAKFLRNEWPTECVTCQETEQTNGTSIRLNSIKNHEHRSREDYLQIGGVLDNICNSACQFCSAKLSTKIGSLISSDYIKIDNSSKFWNLPLERIEHLDINGGEPSASKNYKNILSNLPPNLKTLRVNTNCSLLIPELETINANGVQVTVTVSFDGIGPTHDYVRWPIKWDKFYENLMKYKQYRIHDLNLWTTLNALNINQFEEILNFKDEHQLNHSYGILHSPLPLNIAFTNPWTIKAKERLSKSANKELNQLAELVASKENNEVELGEFIKRQDQLRSINILDFISC